MRDTQKLFKVGDKVVVDVGNSLNRHIIQNPEWNNEVFTVVKISGKHHIDIDRPIVRFHQNGVGYFAERFKLHKTTIVKDIINDL